MNTYALSMSPPAAPPLLVSEREAGRLLGVTPRTVFNLRQRGELPAVKIGTRVLYDRRDVEVFISRKKSESIAPKNKLNDSGNV